MRRVTCRQKNRAVWPCRLSRAATRRHQDATAALHLGRNKRRTSAASLERRWHRQLSRRQIPNNSEPTQRHETRHNGPRMRTAPMPTRLQLRGHVHTISRGTTTCLLSSSSSLLKQTNKKSFSGLQASRCPSACGDPKQRHVCPSSFSLDRCSHRSQDLPYFPNGERIVHIWPTSHTK